MKPKTWLNAFFFFKIYVGNFIPFEEEILSFDDAIIQLFDEDSDVSGSDSRWEEGTDIYSLLRKDYVSCNLRDVVHQDNFLLFVQNFVLHSFCFP